MGPSDTGTSRAAAAAVVLVLARVLSLVVAVAATAAIAAIAAAPAAVEGAAERATVSRPPPASHLQVAPQKCFLAIPPVATPA